MFLRLKKLLIALNFILIQIGLSAFDAPGSGLRPRLTVWVHGTTIRAVIPIKVSGFHFNSRLIAFNELRKGSAAYLRAVSLQSGDSNRFDLDNFYLFRWNGMLNYQERKKAANDLYWSLSAKVEEITKISGQRPIVTIIAHSHGGNIALELARLNQGSCHQFDVDCLILLACPVQKATSGLVNSEIFKRVYVFYSCLDAIQVLALHSGAKFAGRKFDTDLNNVFHIRTSWKKYGLLHNDFKDIKFVSQLPAVLNKVDQQRAAYGSLDMQIMLS